MCQWRLVKREVMGGELMVVKEPCWTDLRPPVNNWFSELRSNDLLIINNNHQQCVSEWSIPRDYKYISNKWMVIGQGEWIYWANKMSGCLKTVDNIRPPIDIFKQSEILKVRWSRVENFLGYVNPSMCGRTIDILSISEYRNTISIPKKANSIDSWGRTLWSHGDLWYSHILIYFHYYITNCKCDKLIEKLLYPLIIIKL